MFWWSTLCVLGCLEISVLLPIFTSQHIGQLQNENNVNVESFVCLFVWGRVQKPKLKTIPLLALDSRLEDVELIRPQNNYPANPTTNEIRIANINDKR